jgi:hypothetical protein
MSKMYLTVRHNVEYVKEVDKPHPLQFSVRSTYALRTRIYKNMITAQKSPHEV